MANPGNPGTTPQRDRVPIVFPDDPQSPTLFINAIQVLIGPNELVVTLGTVMPPQLQTQEDWDSIDQLTAQPFFRFAVAPSTFRDMIGLMTSVYEEFIRQQQGATTQIGDDKRERGTQ